MRQYLELLAEVLQNGENKPNRTGTPARAVFGRQARFDLSAGFPLLTTKKVHWHSVVHELLWFLGGDTNIAYLNKHGVSIWNEWADASGDLGPIYGRQWRSWPATNGDTIDQIANVMRLLRQERNSRRMLVSAWNVSELDDMRLAPCHVLFQFYVGGGKLSCQLYQRSADIFLGVPFNIASYSLLTMMIAHVCGLRPGEFVHTFGDLHLYVNHVAQAKTQLARTPQALPTVSLAPAVTSIFDFVADDITLVDYAPQPRISAPVAV